MNQNLRSINSLLTHRQQSSNLFFLHTIYCIKKIFKLSAYTEFIFSIFSGSFCHNRGSKWMWHIEAKQSIVNLCQVTGAKAVEEQSVPQRVTLQPFPAEAASSIAVANSTSSAAPSETVYSFVSQTGHVLSFLWPLQTEL